jgi:dephospho-CoA kinase
MSSSDRASFSLPRDHSGPAAIPVIGLTGGIGSGKSQVATLLRARGAHVIDADAVGHEVLDRPEVRRQVLSRFGSRVLDSSSATGVLDGGLIDRKALASIVFADQDALHALEAILHPRMLREFKASIDRLAKKGQVPAIVLDAAILLEAGWDALCSLVVFVEAPLPLRQERVARARGWTAEDLRVREAVQWSCARKRKRADVVLPNDADLENLERAVDRCLGVVLGDPSQLVSSGAAARCGGGNHDRLSPRTGDSR